MKDKTKVQFNATQLYINDKGDVDLLKELYMESDTDNKSEFLRRMVMKGAHSEVSRKENIVMVNNIQMYLKAIDVRLNAIECELEDMKETKALDDEKFKVINSKFENIRVALGRQNTSIADLEYKVSTKLEKMYDLNYQHTFNKKLKATDVASVNDFKGGVR